VHRGSVAESAARVPAGMQLAQPIIFEPITKLATTQEKKTLTAGPKLTLQELVHSISQELNTTKDMSHVRDLMAQFDAEKGEWKRYAFWDAKCNYTRNLIATDHKTFTLMQLCWNPGKWSPCHDHSGSECFMRMVEGTLTEVRYEWPEKGQETKPLKPTKTTVLETGGVCFINDALGLHKVGNATTGQSVSLHCYIPGYETCRAWCQPDKNAKACECNVTYYSEGGQKTQH